MAGEYVPFLTQVSAKNPLMWVIDTTDGSVVDRTPATAAAESAQLQESAAYPRTLSLEHHLQVSREVAATGESRTVVEWMKRDGKWRKLARHKSHAGGNHVLEIAQDITQLDPRAEWLARINLDKQRLEMDNGESFSFAEFVVLHLLLKGFKHKRIAETLKISTKTVDYRIAKLKNAMRVDSTEEMMLEVSSSGLIYLALIPVDHLNPAQTEVELYKKIPN